MTNLGQGVPHSRTPRPPDATDPSGDPGAFPQRTNANQSPRRVAAVQRSLTEYGYGQLKATGTVGAETQAAIQRFERERKLPLTGQISDRLVRELAAMTGKAID